MIMSKREKSQSKDGGLKARGQKLKAGILKSYYGNPMRDMKLIAITGSTGKVTVAHYVHEILKESGEQVAVLASDQPFKIGMLHKFLSDAWKAGANYVVVTVPAKVLQANVFYGLPVYVAAITNYATSALDDMEPDEYIESEHSLFDMHPEYAVLNHDDAYYEAFAECKGNKATLDYGQTGMDVKILSSKLYPKGTEATLSVNSEILNVATFVTGEITVSFMACAVAIAKAIGIENNSHIINGLANYEV